MADRNNSVNYKNKMAKLDLTDEIQHQIDDQIRMRDGAMKLMSACSTLNQALETSKNLLTINGRILGLMSALQKKKKQHVLQEYNRQRTNSIAESPEDACMGRVAISDMRIPLMWKDNVHFTGKTGDQSYYAFALIRCGDQVRDTPLYEITSADTDMYFDLAIIFEELPPDFKMDFEVYYTVITSNEAHGIRTPIRTSMNLRTPKKTIHFNAPKFCLAGHVQLTIDDVRIGIISKDLTMGGKGASGVAVLGDLDEFPIHPLELWGQICFQLAAQPKSMHEDVQRGRINIEINSPVNECFCILRQNFIHCWESEETTEQCKPVHSIKLFRGLKVVHQEQGDDMNSIQLTNRDDSIIATLKFSNSSDCFDWKCAIRKQMNNIISWKNAFNDQMHIEEMKRNRLSIPSTASFYDQIKIEEVTNEANRKQVSNSNGHGILNGDSNDTPSDSVFLNPHPVTPQTKPSSIEATPTESIPSQEELSSESLIPNTEKEVGKTKNCENALNNISVIPQSSSTEASDPPDQPHPSNPTSPTPPAEDLVLSGQDPNLSDPNAPLQTPSAPSNQDPQIQNVSETEMNPQPPVDPNQASSQHEVNKTSVTDEKDSSSSNQEKVIDQSTEENMNDVVSDQENVDTNVISCEEDSKNQAQTLVNTDEKTSIDTSENPPVDTAEKTNDTAKISPADNAETTLVDTEEEKEEKMVDSPENLPAADAEKTPVDTVEIPPADNAKKPVDTAEETVVQVGPEKAPSTSTGKETLEEISTSECIEESSKQTESTDNSGVNKTEEESTAIKTDELKAFNDETPSCNDGHILDSSDQEIKHSNDEKSGTDAHNDITSENNGNSTPLSPPITETTVEKSPEEQSEVTPDSSTSNSQSIPVDTETDNTPQQTTPPKEETTSESQLPENK